MPNDLQSGHHHYTIHCQWQVEIFVHSVRSWMRQDRFPVYFIQCVLNQLQLSDHFHRHKQHWPICLYFLVIPTIVQFNDHYIHTDSSDTNQWSSINYWPNVPLNLDNLIKCSNLLRKSWCLSQNNKTWLGEKSLQGLICCL